MRALTGIDLVCCQVLSVGHPKYSRNLPILPPPPRITVQFTPPSLSLGVLQSPPTWLPSLHACLVRYPEAKWYFKLIIKSPLLAKAHEALYKLAAAASLTPASTCLLLVTKSATPDFLLLGDHQPCLASGPLLLLLLTAGHPLLRSGSFKSSLENPF